MWHVRAGKIFASWKEVDGGLDWIHTLVQISMDVLLVFWKTINVINLGFTEKLNLGISNVSKPATGEMFLAFLGVSGL